MTINAIHRFAAEHKLKVHEDRQFAEAYRRYHKFHEGEPLTTAWVGQEMPSHAKGRILVPVHNEIPRCIGWYRLSDFGVKLLEEFNGRHEWHPSYNYELFNS